MLNKHIKVSLKVIGLYLGLVILSFVLAFITAFSFDWHYNPVLSSVNSRLANIIEFPFFLVINNSWALISNAILWFIIAFTISLLVHKMKTR